MFPHDYEKPPGVSKESCRSFVARTVARQLLAPPFCVCPGDSPVLWTGVPEASPYLNGDLYARKHDVGRETDAGKRAPV